MLARLDPVCWSFRRTAIYSLQSREYQASRDEIGSSIFSPPSSSFFPADSGLNLFILRDIIHPPCGCCCHIANWNGVDEQTHVIRAAIKENKWNQTKPSFPVHLFIEKLLVNASSSSRSQAHLNGKWHQKQQQVFNYKDTKRYWHIYCVPSNEGIWNG